MIPTRSRSSPTASRSRSPPAARTSTASATTCSTTINVDNDGDAVDDLDLRVPFTTTSDEPGDVPLQHRADHVAGRPRLEHPPDLHRHREVATASRHGARPEASRSRPTTSVRASTPDYAALARRGHQRPRRRHQGLRRPARRPVLRRPRLDLRPGRLRPFNRPHLIPLRRRSRCRRGRGQQRPLDRHGGARRRRSTSGEDPSSVSGPPPTRRKTRVFARGSSAAPEHPARSSRCPAWATRWSTRSSSRWRSRTRSTRSPRPGRRHAGRPRDRRLDGG